MNSSNDVRVFWGCFIALVTCAFGFVIRTQIIGDWATEFNLDETEKGRILAVGFWPFAFSIFLLSLFIDRVGYGVTAAFGFVCHLVSTYLLVTAKNVDMLYWGTLVFALSNGTVEAYINPAIASMYKQEKTKWLNILHAGWPGGIVLAGLLGIAMADLSWQWKVGLTFLPTIVYGLLLVGTKFPVSERVVAGVTYREMLADFGALGAFVAVYLISLTAFDLKLIDLDNLIGGGQTASPLAPFLSALAPAFVAAAAFGVFTGSLGRPIYFLLLLIMIPLATTELGIDSWITELMEPEMVPMNINPAWVLVYTAAIMTVLRFFAGPIVHRASPLGLLAMSALLAIFGLLFLSKAAGIMILLAATLYALGKTFFWPTMLGVVAERFPRGGAMTLNCIGGVGMLALSIGGVFLGNIQDTRVDSALAAYDQKHQTSLHATYVTQEKTSVFGKYAALDMEKVNTASEEDAREIVQVQATAKKNALATAAIFPCIMLVCYLGLILYFKSQGGYRAESLEAASSD